MTKAELIIMFMTDNGMTLQEATAKADKVWKASNVAEPELSEADKKSMARAREQAETDAKIADGWIETVQSLERKAQQACYSGEIRRATRLANDKMYAKRKLERIKDRML